MTLINEMQLDFVSKSQNEAFARVVVAAFASQLDLTLEEIADIKTAVSEAVTNSIIHGYESSNGTIRITAKLYNDKIVVSVKDWGIGIENIEQAKQPLWTSKPELERSGMGFTIMENFMDDLIVESTPGEGTIIIMSKNLKKNIAARQDK
ncbi:MAG: anti-sigma F factor [Tepidanaerobacteraceae bacterium]|nr:anti-sigma F factor [Thermoanaerobacterales bacterium]